MTRKDTVKTSLLNTSEMSALEINRRMVSLFAATKAELPYDFSERCGEPVGHPGRQMIQDLHRESRVWRVWGYRAVEDAEDEPVFEAFATTDNVDRIVGRAARDHARIRVELITEPLDYSEPDDEEDAA